MLLTDYVLTVRDYTGTSSVTFTDASLKLHTNNTMEALASRINNVNPEFFGRTLTRNLVAGERKYSLPADILSSISKVEVCLDWVNWIDIDPLELSIQEYSMDEVTILDKFNGRDPRYYVFGQNLVILSGVPIIDVTAGIKFYCNLYPTPLANLTDVRDMAVAASDTEQWFPRPFHEILARMVGIVWKSKQDKPIGLTERELRIEDDIIEALKPLRKTVEALQARENIDNGEEY